VQFGFEWGVDRDEPLNADRVIGQTELFEQRWQVVDWGFHEEFLERWFT
jgi:hypothetical protein